MHPECRHIMPNGNKCRSAALRNLPYCYFHTRTHRLTSAKTKDQEIKLPLLEDRSAIQFALAQILDALATGRTDHKTASLLLYGLQIASQNIVRDSSILSSETVHTLTRTSDGQELAPKKLACDQPEDCERCEERKNCLIHRAVIGMNGGVDPYDKPGENEDDGDRAAGRRPRPVGVQNFHRATRFPRLPYLRPWV